MPPSSRPEPVGAVRAHHGEGAVWDAAAGVLLWIDITGRAVHRTAPDGTTTTIPTADDVGFVVPTTGGALLAGVGRAVVRLDPAAATDGAAIDDTATDGAATDGAATGVGAAADTSIDQAAAGGGDPDGARTTARRADASNAPVLAETPEAPVPIRTNDAGVDPAGRLWFGTMARDESPGHGTLHRLAEPTDDAPSAVPILHGLGTPNGPVWSPDGATMYFTDTPTGLVRAWDSDPATGALGPDRVAVDARGVEGSPDGMTVDSDGNLWIAFWGGGAVRCFSPEGRLLEEMTLPVAQPSRPAWGGADGRTLYVTTSRKGLEADELAGQPLAGRLFAVEPGVQGVVPPAAVVAGG